MRRLSSSGLSVGVWVVALAAVAVSVCTAQTSPANPTIWDGAYSDAQAKRGEAVYAAACLSCHGDDLTGQQSRLMGDRFMRDWREDTLGSLFTRTRAVMPRRAPGSLTDTQYLDVIAFVLQQNGFPAGARDLSSESAPKVLVVGKEGPQPVPEFALVQVTGCLKEVPGGWTLTRASSPVRTRTPDVTPAELQSAAPNSTPSTGTFRLMEALAYKPSPNRDHQVMIKGLLIRRPDDRINVTALESLAPGCTPD
jgi:mono/diheme cytochrome c family protein